MEESVRANLQESARMDVPADMDAAMLVTRYETDEGMNFRHVVLDAFPVDDVDIRTYSPLALAFLGDAVYSLIARTMVISKGNRQAEKMHNETTRLVSATRQAAIGRAIQELLTDDERRIYKRGRNANPAHHAKNASVEDYYDATALEVLCAWLYLQDQNERFLYLMREGIKRTDNAPVTASGRNYVPQ